MLELGTNSIPLIASWTPLCLKLRAQSLEHRVWLAVIYHSNYPCVTTTPITQVERGVQYTSEQSKTRKNVQAAVAPTLPALVAKNIEMATSQPDLSDLSPWLDDSKCIELCTQHIQKMKVRVRVRFVEACDSGVIWKGGGTSMSS